MPSCRVTRGDLRNSPGSGVCWANWHKPIPGMRDCEPQVRDAAIQLKDLCGRLRDYAADLEADPARQGLVEDRLELIQRLKAKYGGSVEAVWPQASAPDRTCRRWKIMRAGSPISPRGSKPRNVPWWIRPTS